MHRREREREKGGKRRRQDPGEHSLVLFSPLAIGLAVLELDLLHFYAVLLSQNLSSRMAANIYRLPGPPDSLAFEPTAAGDLPASSYTHRK